MKTILVILLIYNTKPQLLDIKFDTDAACQYAKADMIDKMGQRDGLFNNTGNIKFIECYPSGQ